MADVRVKFTGKQPIVVNDKTWLEGEVHTINEKLALSLQAFGEAIVVLTPVGAEVEEPLPSPPQIGEGAVGEAEAIETMEEKPKRKRK